MSDTFFYNSCCVYIDETYFRNAPQWTEILFEGGTLAETIYVFPALCNVGFLHVQPIKIHILAALHYMYLVEHMESLHSSALKKKNRFGFMNNFHIHGMKTTRMRIFLQKLFQPIVHETKKEPVMVKVFDVPKIPKTSLKRLLFSNKKMGKW